MRRDKIISVQFGVIAFTTVFAMAADEPQIIRSQKSVLSIYSYGGPASRVAPELFEPKRSSTAPLTDVIAVPPLAASPSTKSPPTNSTPSTAWPSRTSPFNRANSGGGGSMQSKTASAAMTSDTSTIVTVRWDPSPDGSVVGYQLYTGDGSRHYTAKQPLGDQTSAQVTVNQGAVYVAVSAYTAEGLESALSEELVVTGDGQSSAGPAGLSGGNR